LTPRPRPAGAQHFGADDQLNPNLLIPGVTVRRYTEPAGGIRLDVAVPCCGRLARLRRGLDHAQALIGCPFCGLAYDVTVIDELDGGHAALFKVREEEVTLARRRHKSGPRDRP
jgi:hypothetical protein